MTEKLDNYNLQYRFLKVLDGTDYSLEEGCNPFRIRLESGSFWVYIMELAIAHSESSDVYQVKLLPQKVFSSMKESGKPLLLCGYDTKNDVYVVWSPLWLKKQLGSSDSITLYSSYSMQAEARKTKGLKSEKIDDVDERIVFPIEMIKSILLNIDHYCLAPEDYNVMGRPAPLVKLKPSRDIEDDKSKVSSKKKNVIRVTFPGGKVVEHRKVNQTLIEVVKYAIESKGIDKVRDLNIIRNKENIIQRDNLPDDFPHRDSFKEVAKGWLCATYSSTDDKLRQIRQISDGLGLHLHYELV